jgi:hypothetical protein
MAAEFQNAACSKASPFRVVSESPAKMARALKLAVGLTQPARAATQAARSVARRVGDLDIKGHYTPLPILAEITSSCVVRGKPPFLRGR